MEDVKEKGGYGAYATAGARHGRQLEAMEMTHVEM